jgi:hypothetical protein
MESNSFNMPTENFGKKPHKFFERYLNNDLEKLKSFLIEKYSQIENAEIDGITPLGSTGKEYWTKSGSTSTVKWREYNVFQFNSPELYNVFSGVRDATKEACEYYEINFEKEQFMVQGWFNITHAGKGKLDWHDHGQPGAPNFHGYYSVKAEPSKTHYHVYGQIVDHENIDNKLIVSEMGHQHAMADWDWEGPRITVAYDILPLRYLEMANAPEQHWIPML